MTTYRFFRLVTKNSFYGGFGPRPSSDYATILTILHAMSSHCAENMKNFAYCALFIAATICSCVSNGRAIITHVESNAAVVAVAIPIVPVENNLSNNG